MTTVPPKIKALLGFAQNSRNLLSGETAVESAVTRNKARLVILSYDLPGKRKFHWENRCQNCGISYVTLGTKEEFGQLLGTSERSVLAVTDDKMAAAIRKELGHKI